MPGQNNGETLAQSQASRLEELWSGLEDLGSSPSRGPAVRIRRHAMGNQFFFMASGDNEGILVATLLSHRPLCAVPFSSIARHVPPRVHRSETTAATRVS